MGLSPSGAAQVTISVESEAAPMHEGTQAKIVENSLSGIANHYIVLNPAPQSAPVISSGGVIPETYTTAEVSLDELFDSLDSSHSPGLRGFIQGEAAAIQGKSSEANRTLQYFAPALTSTSDVAAGADARPARVRRPRSCRAPRRCRRSPRAARS